jgi:hypothetical protein
MEQHNYRNKVETVVLDKLKSETSQKNDLIENLRENVIYTIRGLTKKIEKLKFPQEFQIDWGMVPYRYKVTSSSGNSYKKNGNKLIEAVKNGITDPETLIEMVTKRRTAHQKEQKASSEDKPYVF